MFEDLNAELGKVEATVRSAFTDTKASVQKHTTTIQTIDADLLAAFDRLGATAKKAETTVHGRLEDIRAMAKRLVT